MESRAQVVMFAGLTVVLATCNCGWSASPRPVITPGTLYAIHVARISKPSNTAAEGLSIDFGRVEVSSPAFDDVVRVGPRIIPTLVAMMERKDLDFDRFCRYYSACEQVFSATSPKLQTYWQGGAKHTKSGIAPRPGQDNVEFRKRVIESINSNYRLVSGSKR